MNPKYMYSLVLLDWLPKAIIPENPLRKAIVLKKRTILMARCCKAQGQIMDGNPCSM